MKRIILYLNKWLKPECNTFSRNKSIQKYKLFTVVQSLH